MPLPRNISNLFAGDMPEGNAAMDVVGFPHGHNAPIGAVANDNEAIIISREVGCTCTTLIEEGYDTKGYRIHGKSTDWGPMAGFVVRDPKLSKKGVGYATSQEAAHNESLNDTNSAGWRASTTPLYISDARRAWLMRERRIGPTLRGDVYSGRAEQSGAVIDYQLRRTMLGGDMTWAVWYKHTTEAGGYRHMEAMVNPYPAWPRGHYKNAVTGDYDLFAVWPIKANYDPRDEDRRLGGMGPAGATALDTAANNRIIIQNEDNQMGNITNRVFLIAQSINSAVGAIGHGFPNRNMCHHSDEGGRPFVGDVDLPLVAFVPTQTRNYAFGISTINQFRAFAAKVNNLGFRVILNAGWVRQTGSFGNAAAQDWGNSWSADGVGYEWANRNG